MYASNLEQLLFELAGSADVSPGNRSDMARRFDSLRSYGRLPMGRENHTSFLSDEQIAAAILGLASDKPGWAGHVSLLLGNLVPVGGQEAALFGASTLLDAIGRLVADDIARQSLIFVNISGAESGTNANGSGTVKIRTTDGVRATTFVSRLAFYERGAEKTFDHDVQFSPLAHTFAFNSRFFDQVARDTAHVRKLKSRPISNGSEYDAEEIAQRRREKLGVQLNSRYLMVGVDNQVTWPQSELLVHFDRFTLVLMPKTREHMQSISIDLTANKLSMREAKTVVNRFLSLMTWCDDQFAVAQDGWAGNPFPTPVPRRNLAFTTTHHWMFDRKIPIKEETRRALALYREARNAEQNFLVSYAVLNYYKIVELRHPKGPQTRSWLAQAFPKIEPTIRPEIIALFHKERGGTVPEKHIYDAYRLAVAHASEKTISDPDNADESTRLYVAAEILRKFARHFISTELKVSDSPFSGH